MVAYEAHGICIRFGTTVGPMKADNSKVVFIENNILQYYFFIRSNLRKYELFNETLFSG